MATGYPNIALTPDLRSLLAGLRWRIRLFIWVEGLSLAIIWLGAMFWIGLALDYLPVLVGASEMPAAARGVLLVGTGGVLAWIFYRWIISRAFVPLSDQSMALLLERRFAGFDESLVTAVEMADLPDHAAAFNPDLLSKTAEEARAQVDAVRYRQVFRSGSLAWKVLLAAGFVLSVVAFSATNAEAFNRAAERLYLLSNEPWPRSAYVEVVGVEVIHLASPGEEAARTVTLPFEDGVVKVARGANVSLQVRAAQPPDADFVPQTCTVYYRTLKTGDGIRGERGSVTMSNFRDGDAWRTFWFDNKPFEGVLASIEFDVLGYDHRTSTYRLEVVDSPAVVETLLDIEFPAYMVDEATSSHLPVIDQPYLPAGTFVPIGSQVTVKFRANKHLRQAQIVPSAGGEPMLIDVAQDAGDPSRFAYRIDALAASTTLEVSLLDADNVATERPFRVFLTAVEDQPPQVEVALQGIGDVVTPDVVIPLRGKITDDYAVADTWLDVQVNESGDVRDVPFGLKAAGAVEHELDFRNERAARTGLETKPGDTLFLSVKAADEYDLADVPHVATGDRYQLGVVTPDELLAQLEVREIGLRRRFEQILDEMTQLRDSLLRVKSSLDPTLAGTSEALQTPDVPEETALSPEQAAQRETELRLLRVQRAIQQGQKSMYEVLGVAAGFLDIREELINNRVDTEDRKTRLKDQIADPLNKTCAEGFPQLDQRLTTLEVLLREGGLEVDVALAGPQADETIDQANRLLIELEEVLARMQDLETYNELLDIVRGLLKDQEQLLQRTQQEHKRQTIEAIQGLQ